MVAPKKSPITKIIGVGVKAAMRGKKTSKGIAVGASGNKDKITTGLYKAVGKVQKGLDKTSNRVPTINARAGITPKGKIKITENGFTGVSRGSNKAAAKGNAPKRTPGVKKNTSLQRSINKSNNNLKK
jgi:hypothetical protein